MSPRARMNMAWVSLVVCLITWPITSLTIFRKEPQAVIGLSWIALIYTAVNTLMTADVRKEVDGD